MGKEFKGVYNLYDKNLLLFSPSQKATEENSVPIDDLNNKLLDEKVGGRDAGQLREDVELLDGVYGQLDVDDYLNARDSACDFWFCGQQLLAYANYWKPLSGLRHATTEAYR